MLLRAYESRNLYLSHSRALNLRKKICSCRSRTTLPALSRTRSYFDKTAARKEQKSQELKTITAKDHHEWGYNLLVLPQFNKGKYSLLYLYQEISERLRS